MPDEPILPPAATKLEVQEVEDPMIGLSLQFIVAIMLTQGTSELRIPKAMLEQAMDKLITATTEPDGGFTVRLFRN